VPATASRSPIMFTLLSLIIWTLLPWSFYEVNLVLGVLIIRCSYHWPLAFYNSWRLPISLLNVLYGVIMILPLDRYRSVLQYFQPFTEERQAILPTYEMTDK
jgi:hypothetical protein